MFEQQGWEKKEFPDDPSYYLTNGIYEAGMDWDSKDGEPNLTDLKKDEFVIDDVPFLGLARVREWKLKKGTLKHLADVELIDNYLNSI